MVNRKQSLRPGSEKNANGFTTERSVGGERRSIRHYNDGRVSQRGTPIPSSPRTPTRSNTIPRPSTRAPNTKGEYQHPSAAAIAKLCVAVDKLLQPEGTKESRKAHLQKLTSKSGASSSFDDLDTPVPPVASPTPESSPELMATTEFFAAVSTEKPPVKSANTISDQWSRIGGKKWAALSEIHDSTDA